MKRTRGKFSIPNLESLVGFLNGGGDTEHPLHAPSRANLIALITEWQRARCAPPNDLERKHGAPLPLLFKMRSPTGSPTLQKAKKCLIALLTPQGKGAGFMIAYSPRRRWTAWDYAWNHFIHFLQNEAIERLAGPCKKCGRYYVRKTAKPSVYCSRQCASQATAIKRTTEYRKLQHIRKLEHAANGIERWRSLAAKGRTKKGWKEFLADHYKSEDSTIDLTVRFLSRAVNNGELVPPDAIHASKR